jgi:hypothetical protein
MARPERYFIGPAVRDQLREVISRTTGTPTRSPGTQIPVRLETIQRPAAGVRLGKTTANWTKGTTATIELYEEGTPPGETKKTPADTLTGCVNKFATVASGKWVIVAAGANGSWYLLAAECE